jgi:hypothetical protein
MDENPFRYNPIGIDQARKSLKPEEKKDAQERLHIEIRVAGPEDWEAYKQIRTIAVNSKDANFLNTIEVVKDKIRNTVNDNEKWKKDLNRDDFFVFLAWSQNNVVGMGYAVDQGKGIWRLGGGYVLDNFRGIHVGRKMWTARIREIQKRGGLKVVTGIKYKNKKTQNLAQSIDFQEVDFLTRVMRTKSIITPLIFQGFELDLTDPKVIKHLEEVESESDNNPIELKK